ncbi:helix-turn-helix domain-containing protein [Candidatus Halobonum tyrrellensis]|uniref:DNA binding protein n=1 Tax=Candidatus Halobonum tyrrellensis G22 TaxID=1324957 RepID=V4HAV6_9EURY|nr:helix-turn-helix domain-containing protein [Candidatus Halobonum tyrrellensis]ESP87193.1 DNA binding protein [Candidatus Halobonum tyrrellensis G22]
MRRVTFEVTYPPELAHPLHRRLTRESGVSRMELLAWGPTATVTTLSWYDADPETTAAVLAAVESIAERHLVESDEGTYAFVHQTDFEFADDLMDLVSQANVVFVPPVTFRDDGSATVEAVGETASLSAFHDRLTDLVDVRVERVRAFGRRASSAALTDRQRAALDAAVTVGYYEVPRVGGVADVAAELDCAPSTAGELLRKAEAAVVTDYASAAPAEIRR